MTKPLEAPIDYNSMTFEYFKKIFYTFFDQETLLYDKDTRNQAMGFLKAVTITVKSKDLRQNLFDLYTKLVLMSLH